MISTRWIVLSMAMLICVGAAAAAPLAEFVPTDALFYYGWVGRTAAFDDSLLGQMAQEPLIGEALAAHLGDGVTARPVEDFEPALWALGNNRVLADPAASAAFIFDILDKSGAERVRKA
ncbi:hypothetical protein LCGC14_2816140, partial [marine sediment metagenome]